MMALKPPGYIVVEGPIGVGKTSFVKRLAESFECETLLEEPDDNPFLKRFYDDPKGAALPVQLQFLLQREKQLACLKQKDLFQATLISDFMFEKDRLFAELNLDEDEMNLYNKVASVLAFDIPVPDLVVFLTAPLDILKQRIETRNRDQEEHLDIRYIERLANRYTDFFYHYNEAPVLIVNTSEINPIASDEDFELLKKQICATQHGKHFFNPLSLA